MTAGERSSALNAVPHQPPTPQLARGEATAQPADNIGLTFETLGYMVYRRIIPLEIAEDLVGGMVSSSWQRVHGWAELGRETTGNPALFEWFEWLNDRLLEYRKPTKTIGAFRARGRWKP